MSAQSKYYLATLTTLVIGVALIVFSSYDLLGWIIVGIWGGLSLILFLSVIYFIVKFYKILKPMSSLQMKSLVTGGK